MAYGTQQEVAAMASMWTRNGVWVNPAGADPGTNPNIVQVETWLDNISAQMNIALGSGWFVTPITVLTPNAHKAVSQYVVSLVADLCHFKNSSGRFFTERLVERGITPMAAILHDMKNWIDENKDGLLQDGVTQRAAPAKQSQVQFYVLGRFGSRDRTGRYR